VAPVYEGCMEMWQAGGRVCFNDFSCADNKAYVCEVGS